MTPPIACDAKICGARTSVSYPYNDVKEGRHAYIKTVVVAEDKLELRGEVAQGAGHEAEKHSGGYDCGPNRMSIPQKIDNSGAETYVTRRNQSPA